MRAVNSVSSGSASACAGDIQKWLTMALDDGLPGDWGCAATPLYGLLTPLRSLSSTEQMTDLERQLEGLHAEIDKYLKELIFSKI